MAVAVSKNDSGTPQARTWSRAAIRSASASSTPSTRMRSEKRSRCGDVNRPVRSPWAVSRAAVMAAVDPLPLVPATWTAGKARCGEPRARRAAAMGPRPHLTPKRRRPNR